MNFNDGRVVSNFILQALRSEDITVYGDGSATRSFQYMHDLIDGLIQLMESDCTEPVNLGNPHEFTIKEFANMVIGLVNEQRDQPSTSNVVYLPAVIDDPPRRKPDISRAKERLNWQPRISVHEGLSETGGIPSTLTLKIKFKD
jgi:UDP-glucuronate decarboxylase